MRDPLAIARGAATDPRLRSNFAGPRNLSYSYASPFSNAWDYQLNSDHMPAEFALMADKNPGFATVNLEVTGPARDAQPFELEKANSLNHQRAGQNVLFAAGYVAFMPTPYCGVGNDNIFTALAPSRLNGEHPPLDRPGYLGHSVGPAYKYDSYLVPTAGDGTGQAP
jgi:hypothetical protein